MKKFRDLKVKLTEEEWSANASALAQAQQDLQKLEEEFTTVKSTYKGRLETIAEKAKVVGEKVRSREEIRAVECFDRNDERRFIVETFRADYGSLVDTRPMTANERQLAMQPSLPGIAPKPKDAKPIDVTDELLGELKAAAGTGMVADVIDEEHVKAGKPEENGVLVGHYRAKRGKKSKTDQADVE